VFVEVDIVDVGGVDVGWLEIVDISVDVVDMFDDIDNIGGDVVGGDLGSEEVGWETGMDVDWL
jgi:hypothetical protein